MRAFHRILLTGALLLPFTSLAAPLAMPQPAKAHPAVSVEQIRASINELDRVIGSYPPKIASEVERNAVYARWSNALQQAWRVEGTRPTSEPVIALLADLYRQGHNQDVADAGTKADQTIAGCLATFPASVPCHNAASYFYLSVDTRFAPKGEASLVWLREHHKPNVNLNVERGFVFAYLYQGRNDEAIKQVDYLLTLDPKAEWARKMREALVSGKVSVKRH